MISPISLLLPTLHRWSWLKTDPQFTPNLSPRMWKVEYQCQPKLIQYKHNTAFWYINIFNCLSARHKLRSSSTLFFKTMKSSKLLEYFIVMMFLLLLNAKFGLVKNGKFRCFFFFFRNNYGINFAVLLAQINPLSVLTLIEGGYYIIFTE